MVEAPIIFLFEKLFTIFVNTARIMASGSIPICSKNFLSSAEMNA